MEKLTSSYSDQVQAVITNSSGTVYYPSPLAWEDQVLYFLMLDRFSDGNEDASRSINGDLVTGGTTPQFSPQDYGNAVRSKSDAKLWRESGAKWCGGTLQGLKSKIGYLKRLGVTAIWLSPLFKQVSPLSEEETYHGYGIQNFLDVDPHFGSRQDLKQLVALAHENGIYIIMDIILNHAGNIFGYDHSDREPPWRDYAYPVKGYNDEMGRPIVPFSDHISEDLFNKGAVWPQELQEPKSFTREGKIVNWNHDPEFYRGDFCNLKDISLGHGDLSNYRASEALTTLVEVYKFWIGYADLDGFRIDTVKHMDKGATRLFSSAIEEYAQSIGKENFYLIGEITGGRWNAFTTMEQTGLNAALGINEIPGKIEGVAKGYTSPIEYFELFRHSLKIGKDSHTWFRNKVVTMFDDHDQVRKGNNKARFCADGEGHTLLHTAIALNLFSEGIPCIYYGTEQNFDGMGGNDRYLRECMFGGDFGAFRTKERHFFNEETEIYREIAAMSKIRRKQQPLRRGRQYLRQISGNGIDFGFPERIGLRMRSLVAWSRIFNKREILIVVNTDPFEEKSAWVTIDNSLHSEGESLRTLYGTKGFANNYRIENRNGKSISLSLPPGHVIVLEKA
ncbi:MAG: glycosidase [Desulforhopalus sp.]|jgi:glycosidase